MAKKLLFILVWTITFALGGACLLGFATGVGFVVYASSTGNELSQQAIERIGMAWALAPQVFGAVGLVLGVLGQLPGTRRQAG